MLNPPSPDDARRLREFLSASGYTHKNFQEMPLLRELPLGRSGSPELKEHTATPTPMNVLLRWFFLGMTQTAPAAAEAVPADVIGVMVKCGLLRESEAGLVPTVLLTPCNELYFAADPATRMNTPESADIVLWPNPTTRLLEQFAVRRRSSATLDLGAGCGIIGVLAAEYSDHITATDLNPRFETFTQFNARLNGVEGIECLRGDTFEPVKDRKFDLILANPPFFVTPTSGQMFCENDMELDQYCRRVVRETPAHLNEGGFFQAVLEWVQVKGQTWQERLQEWLDGSGCDAWVMRTYVRDAAGYARERIRENYLHESLATRMEVWMEYYRQRGVEEIHGGILAMRRRSGNNWLRLEGSPVEASAPFGDVVLATFSTQDILNDHPSDAELLAMRVRLPEDAQLEQAYRPAGGKWSATTMQIRLTGAAPAQSAVEREVAGFLARCDGSRPLMELADELGAKVPVPIERVREQVCTVVRTLASRRILHLARD